MTEGRSEGSPLGGDSDSYVEPWEDALKARRDFSKGSKTAVQQTCSAVWEPEALEDEERSHLRSEENHAETFENGSK